MLKSAIIVLTAFVEQQKQTGKLGGHEALDKLYVT